MYAHAITRPEQNTSQGQGVRELPGIQEAVLKENEVGDVVLSLLLGQRLSRNTLVDEVFSERDARSRVKLLGDRKVDGVILAVLGSDIHVSATGVNKIIDGLETRGKIGVDRPDYDDPSGNNTFVYLSNR